MLPEGGQRVDVLDTYGRGMQRTVLMNLVRRDKLDMVKWLRKTGTVGEWRWEKNRKKKTCKLERIFNCSATKR
jgi:hypothetical protein